MITEMDQIPVTNAGLHWDGHNIVIEYPNLPDEHFPEYAPFARALNKIEFSVMALANVEVTTSSTETGYVRFIPRDGASSIHSAANGEVPPTLDPISFDFSTDKELVIEYYAHEIRSAINAHGLSRAPAHRYEIQVPETVTRCIGKDGALWIKKDEITLSWGSHASPIKRSHGMNWHVPISAIESISWTPGASTVDHEGFIQIRLAGSPGQLEVDPGIDINAVMLDTSENHVSGLLVTAVTLQRMVDVDIQPAQSLVDSWIRLYSTGDGLGGYTEAIIKLRQLDRLHNAGILTDEEFQEKKKDLLGQI